MALLWCLLGAAPAAADMTVPNGPNGAAQVITVSGKTACDVWPDHVDCIVAFDNPRRRCRLTRRFDRGDRPSGDAGRFCPIVGDPGRAASVTRGLILGGWTAIRSMLR